MWTEQLKKLRKLEKLDYQLWKAQIDVEWDSNPQPLSSQMNTKSLNQTCCHLNLGQEFLDIQANYWVQIHSKTRMIHDSNMQSRVFSQLEVLNFCVATKSLKSSRTYQ